MNVTGRMLIADTFLLYLTKCEKINLLFRRNTYKKFCPVHMQHYAAFATLQHAILFTHKNENQKVAKYMPHQCHTGNKSSKSTANSKLLGTMQTKIAFMKKFRTNLT